jgi:ribonuclease P protein component
MGATSLTRARDFVRVQSTGRRARSNGISVAVLATGRAEPSRLGVAVGRRVGGAVDRNRVKRRLRAAWRESGIPDGYEVVVRPSKEVLDAEFQNLVNHLKLAVTRASTERSA